jgi:hypothetical protein
MKKIIIKSIIILLTSSAFIACEKENESDESDNNSTNQNINNDSTDQNINNDSTNIFSNTTWTTKSSVNMGGDTTTVLGTMNFLSEGYFDYSEEYLQFSSAVSIDTVEGMSGSYTYTGEPNADSNLVFTYVDSDSKEIINYATYYDSTYFGSDFIWITLDGVLKELHNVTITSSDDVDENNNDSINNSIDLTGTTWESDSFYNESLDEQNYLVIDFNTGNECKITMQQSNGSMSSDNTYTVSDSTVSITYTDIQTFQEVTASGTIKDNTFDMNMYGEDLTFTKQ